MIVSYLDKLEQLTVQFESALKDVDEEKIRWKPSDDQWSVEQILEHIIIINSSYFPLTEQLRRGEYKKPFIGKFRWLVAYFGKVVLKSVQPNETKKMRTFPIWEPSKSNLSEEVVDQFFKHQEEFKNWIETNEDLIHQNPVISSPANVNIVYFLQSAIDILLTHEDRHLQQLKTVLDIKRNSNEPL